MVRPGTFAHRNISLVRLVDILYSDNGQVSVVSKITESDSSSNLYPNLVNVFLRNVEGNRDGEKIAICQAIVLDNTM
jgi:hypothetical protein